MKSYLEKNSGKISFALLSLSLFVSFIFNLDSAGSGGHIADFNGTWGYVEALTKHFFIYPSQTTTKVVTDNTPLGYMILSWINYFFNDEYIVRLIYCAISITLPILFYFALKGHYENLDSNTLLLLASIIFLLPSFRAGAIWANNSVVANIFFLTYVIFLNSWLKKAQFNKIDINILYQLFFLALAVYTRQYYALIYLYAMYIYFKKLSLKNFLMVSLIVFIFTLPGFWLLLNDPSNYILLTHLFNLKIYNTILISPSIMAFYLIPIFLILFLNKVYTFDFKDKYNVLSTIFFIILISIISIIFDYNYRVGGGFFVKLSYLFFDNLILGIATSVIGLILLSHLAREDNDNLVLVVILILGFPSHFIFQKYFEPMFFLMLFLMFKSEIPKMFLKTKKNIYYLALYLGLYLASGILNHIFKITKTFVT
jgi:hypothetical protein